MTYYKYDKTPLFRSDTISTRVAFGYLFGSDDRKRTLLNFIIESSQVNQ
jgi:hypothetical protein